MTVDELMTELRECSIDGTERIALSVMGEQSFATQVVTEITAKGTTIIIDDFPTGF